MEQPRFWRKPWVKRGKVSKLRRSERHATTQIPGGGDSDRHQRIQSKFRGHSPTLSSRPPSNIVISPPSNIVISTGAFSSAQRKRTRSGETCFLLSAIPTLKTAVVLQTPLPVCPPPSRSVIVSFMFENFTATDRWTKKEVHCAYQAQIVAIATRHADAVDYKFLVDGRKVWVALPHPAWVEYKKRTGRSITDPLAVEIAGHYLKTALESGEGVGREMYSLTVEETLAHLEAAVTEMQAQPA